MTRDATGAARAGLSSYHRMKQRAEIAEAEELRLGAEMEALLQRWSMDHHCYQQRSRKVGELEVDNNALQLEVALLKHQATKCQATWRHDLGSVVGGVLLAFGLIAAIVWGIYG